MFCQECGQKLDKPTKFCPNCGTVLAPIATGQSSSSPIPPPMPKEQRSSLRLGFKSKPVRLTFVAVALGLGWASFKSDPPPLNRHSNPPVQSSNQSNIAPYNDPKNSQSNIPPRVNNSNQELARLYVSFIQEENQIMGTLIGAEAAQLRQNSMMNPSQQSAEALSNFYRKHLQQVQFLNVKLGAFPQNYPEVNRFIQAQRAYLAAVMQLDQILISNPNANSKALGENLKARGQEADLASTQLAASLGLK